MNGPERCAYIHSDGTEHYFYLHNNPWKCGLLVENDRAFVAAASTSPVNERRVGRVTFSEFVRLGEGVKVYRYCVVCGRDQYPAVKSWGWHYPDPKPETLTWAWENAPFISRLCWEKTCQVQPCDQGCKSELPSLWEVWEQADLRYRCVITGDDVRLVCADPSIPRYEPDFEYDTSHKPYAKGLGSIISDSAIRALARACNDSTFSLLEISEGCCLEMRHSIVWAEYIKRLFNDTPFVDLCVISDYLGECQQRARLIGVWVDKWALHPIKLRKYMTHWRCLVTRTPDPTSILCAYCELRPSTPLFAEDNYGIGLCSVCGHKWIEQYKWPDRLVELDKLYKSPRDCATVDPPSLSTSCSETHKRKELEGAIEALQARLKRLPKTAEEPTASCIICMDNVPNATFKDCGHTGFCLECANSIQASRSPQCPTCRTELKEGVLRLY